VNSINGNFPVRIADICSGSGCIALALKSTLKFGSIEALELSDDALSLIKDNIAFTGVNVEVQKFDALSKQYASLSKDYSVIVSNPPYIPYKDEALMHLNVLEHEPQMALFVEDNDPFIFYEKICEDGFQILKNEGWIYFDIHEDLAYNVKSIMETNGFVNIEVRKDLQGKERMIRGQKLPSRHEQE
jgi:release factor glutamine methyltransferase